MNLATRFKTDCSACPVRHRAVCAKCETDELEELNRVKFYKSFQPGQTVALRGEELEVVSSVVAGVATLSRSIEDGRTQMVGLLLPSDFIGRPGRASLDYDVTAVTEMTLCCFRRGPFERLIREMPHVRDRLLEMALDELDAARDWMLVLGRKSAREKVASLLVLVLRRTINPDGDGAGAPARIHLPITREAMANYLGLTIETVSRQITQLRKDGIIALDGTRGIAIPDVAALLAQTGDDEDGGMIV